MEPGSLGHGFPPARSCEFDRRQRVKHQGAAMSIRTDRRRFLKASAAGSALLGLGGELGFLSQLRPVTAEEASLDPNVVRFQPEIEPLVRLLEDTPRSRLLEEVAARIQKGLSYR